MKRITLPRTIGFVVTALCIMAIMAAAVSAADESGPARPGGKNSPAQGTNGNQKYTMSQTLSDQAQKTAIAFSALAFLTGDACSDTFLPPGKVADYAGFQYLRDNDATQMGHNTDFVTRVGRENIFLWSFLTQEATFGFLSSSKATWQWACDAREDWQVLKAMHPEVLRRYCGKRRP